MEAIPNNDCFSTSLNSASDVFYLDLQMDSSLKELCDALGQRLDYDPKKIVLWRSTSPTERPGSLITQEDFQHSTMHDLISTGGNFLHDPRNCRPYTIYYSKIPIPFEELINHLHCRVALMDSKFQIKACPLYSTSNNITGGFRKSACFRTKQIVSRTFSRRHPRILIFLQTGLRNCGKHLKQ